MKQVEKKERSIKFLELLRKIMIFIFISIPVISIVILIINGKFLEMNNVMISIGCAIGELFCIGFIIYEIEWLIKTKHLSIENDKQCEIVSLIQLKKNMWKFSQNHMIFLEKHRKFVMQMDLISVFMQKLFQVMPSKLLVYFS